MYNKAKFILIYISLATLIVLLAVNLAQAEDLYEVAEVEAVENIELDQAELDQMLAPIALYPDTVLSQVLVASTYPLELVQAARWRENNSDLNEKEALDAVEEQDWDPSVKALVPFENLLQQLVEDLNWLQDLGDAFLTNETQVLASVQSLRQKAYEQGSLSNNKYIEVVEEDEDIIITPVSREVVYVPYYDTRVVYGNWHWIHHPPRYWHRPAHYYWHAGLYWSPRVYIRNSIFFGGFHWRNRHTVVHYSPRRYGRYDDGIRRVSVNEYQRWNHNSHHRRGVRYSQHTPKTVYRNRYDGGVKRTRTNEYQPQKVRHTVSTQKRTVSNGQVSRTQQKLRQTKSYNTQSYNNQSPAKRQVTNSGHSTSKQRTVSQSKQRSYSEPKQRSYSQPKQRSYSQPKQRSYSQPKQRSYSQPKQRSHSQPKQRSYSQPKQRSHSQPKQRSYSQPKQQARTNSHRPRNQSVRSSTNVRNQSVKQKQR